MIAPVVEAQRELRRCCPGLAAVREGLAFLEVEERLSGADDLLLVRERLMSVLLGERVEVGLAEQRLGVLESKSLCKRVRDADETTLQVLEVHLIFRARQKRGQQMTLGRKLEFRAFALGDVLDLDDLPAVVVFHRRDPGNSHKCPHRATVGGNVALFELYSATDVVAYRFEHAAASIGVRGMGVVGERPTLQPLGIAEEPGKRRVDPQEAAAAMDSAVPMEHP